MTYQGISWAVTWAWDQGDFGATLHIFCQSFAFATVLLDEARSLEKLYSRHWNPLEEIWRTMIKDRRDEEYDV